MRSIASWHVAATALALVLSGLLQGQTPRPAPKPANPFPYAEHEPKAKTVSVANAHEYLDDVARFWMKTDSCGACHANFAYMMARPASGRLLKKGSDPRSLTPFSAVSDEQAVPLVAETRRFLENASPTRTSRSTRMR
jgi:hypothetical protein